MEAIGVHEVILNGAEFYNTFIRGMILRKEIVMCVFVIIAEGFRHSLNNI